MLAPTHSKKHPLLVWNKRRGHLILLNQDLEPNLRFCLDSIIGFHAFYQYLYLQSDSVLFICAKKDPQKRLVRLYRFNVHNEAFSVLDTLSKHYFSGYDAQKLVQEQNAEYDSVKYHVRSAYVSSSNPFHLQRDSTYIFALKPYSRSTYSDIVSVVNLTQNAHRTLPIKEDRYFINNEDKLPYFAGIVNTEVVDGVVYYSPGFSSTIYSYNMATRAHDTIPVPVPGLPDTIPLCSHPEACRGKMGRKTSYYSHLVLNRRGEFVQLFAKGFDDLANRDYADIADSLHQSFAIVYKPGRDRTARVVPVARAGLLFTYTIGEKAVYWVDERQSAAKGKLVLGRKPYFTTDE